MREIITRVYEFDELTEDAKEKARDWFRDLDSEECFPLDEAMDSLKALFKAAGIKLTDWSVGAYSQGCFVSFDLGDAKNLKGKRALAWLENNLLSGLRITAQEFNVKRKSYISYGDAYRVGKVRPCPLTGVCYDEDLLRAVLKAVNEGETLKDAFSGLADVVRQVVEAEIEYQHEDEQVDESIRANGYTFTEDGQREG